MTALKSPVIANKLKLILGDFIISFLSFYVGYTLRYFDEYLYIISNYSFLLPRAAAFSICIIFVSVIMDLYSSERIKGRKELFLKILFSGVISALLLAVFYYFVPSARGGRSILFSSILVSIIFRYICYLIYDFGLIKLTGNDNKILILGTGHFANAIGQLFEFPENNYALAGYVNLINEPVHVPDKFVIEHGNGNNETLLDIALRKKAQKIVVSLTERRGMLPVKEVLNCKLNGIEIVDAPIFYEQILGKLFIESNPSHLIFSDGFKNTVTSRYLKRMFDIIFAVAGIVLSLPFFLLLPVLIKIDSRGPALFKQERVGEGERKFMVYKFRTMVDGAERNTGPVWSQSGDSRITKLGRILRKSRLDEIPQLINVIRGDMSFIGPRPERPFFVESLKKQIPYYSERHCMKPGVTGWAQVRYEYGDSIEDAIEKLRYDLYYIKYQSLSLDLLIILDTIKVILFGRGGR